MRNTIKATVEEIINHHTRLNGPTEDQRMRQCAEAIQRRAGVGPAQLEAVHVYLAACRILEQQRAEYDRAGDGMPELQAEAALDRAHSAWIEAESHLLRLCANVEVEVAHAV
jgi:hypothetical protein